MFPLFTTCEDCVRIRISPAIEATPFDVLATPEPIFVLDPEPNQSAQVVELGVVERPWARFFELRIDVDSKKVPGLPELLDEYPREYLLVSCAGRTGTLTMPSEWAWPDDNSTIGNRTDPLASSGQWAACLGRLHGPDRSPRGR